jgi:hypothetical protein
MALEHTEVEVGSGRRSRSAGDATPVDGRSGPNRGQRARRGSIQADKKGLVATYPASMERNLGGPGRDLEAAARGAGVGGRRGHRRRRWCGARRDEERMVVGLCGTPMGEKTFPSALALFGGSRP